jgi:PAS domain S-box-containing protein
MIDRYREFSPEPIRKCLQGLVVMVGYYCLMRLGYAMASHSNLPIVSPAFGLAFAVILMMGRGVVALLFTADLLAQWAIQSAPGHAFSLAMPTVALGNILGVALGVEILRMAVRGQTIFDAPRFMLLFLLAATPAAACVAMLGHLSMFMQNNMLWDSNLSQLIAASLISSGIGIVVVAPLIMAFGDRGRGVPGPDLGAPSRGHSAEAAALFAALLMMSWLIFGSAFAGRFEGYPLLLAFLPILLLAAVRLDSRLFTTLTVLFSAIAIVGAVTGHGPYAGAYLTDTLLQLQCYLGAMAGAALVLHGVMRDARQLGVLLNRNQWALHEAERALDKRAMKQSAELAQERNRLRCVLETMSEAYLFVSADGQILEVNPALCRISGCSRNELLAMRLTDLLRRHPLPASDPGQWSGDRDSMAFETALMHAQSTAFPCRVHACGFYEGEQWLGYLLFITDIGAENRTEILRRDIERVARLDFKPLLDTVIATAAQLRADAGLGEAQNRRLDAIEDAGRQMLRSVRESLELLKMERGVYRPQRERVDLIPMLEELGRERLPGHPGRRLGIRLFGKPVSSGDAYFVHGEQPLLRMMLDGLIRNALQASPDDGEVLIALDEDDQRYTCGAHTIGIHNQGVIPAAVCDRFWEKYAPDERRDDLDPGPYEARLIVEAHGGQINFTSSESHGTMLNVHLPMLTPRR